MIRIEDKIEEVTNLIVEAKYIVEEIINNPQYPKLLGTKRLEYLEVTTELIGMLAKIEDKKIEDLPIEAVYKFLYFSYKQVQDENKKLKQDLRELFVSKDLDEEKQNLIMRVTRAEREVEALKIQLENKSRKLEERTVKYRNIIRELKSQLEKY